MKNKVIAIVEFLIIAFFCYQLFRDIDKIPIVKDYIYMLVIESLGIDIYIKLKNKI